MSAEAPWLREQSGVATLAVHVQPGAKKTECAGSYGEALKIRLAAPPVDGKANAALVEFIAARLGVAKAAVTIKSGHSSRAKVIAVDGAPSDTAQRLLAGV